MRKVPDAPRRPKPRGQSWKCWEGKHAGCRGFVNMNHGQKINCGCGCHNEAREAVRHDDHTEQEDNAAD